MQQTLFLTITCEFYVLSESIWGMYLLLADELLIKMKPHFIQTLVIGG